MRWYRTASILIAAPLLAGCGTQLQSSLDPAGAQAGSIGHLWWMYFWVMTGIYVVVVIFALVAVCFIISTFWAGPCYITVG